MWVAVYLAALLLGATASPNGYYHQQYNYKTSSSSYKNNELQHKTDDQGYYSKDGDLEGRVKPKVSSNSEHSEYVNPQLREGLNAGYYDAGTDLTSHGNMLANSYGSSIGGEASMGYQGGSRYGNDLYSEGIASSDHIGGATGVYGAYGSGSSHSSYGSSSLSTVASRLQNVLQHDIQNALRSQSQYSHQTDISELEAELRRNLTARLNEILQEQYGTQTIRGGQSYSLSGGRLQTRPNYEQRDLENLQKQIENSLMYQLRTTSQTNSQNYARYESTTTYRPTTYRNIYPNLNVITTQRPLPEYPGGSKDSYYSQHEYNANRVSSNVRYTPVPNPLSITTIASQVQSQLDSQLNRLLEQAQRQYFSENSGYSEYNTDSILERLRQELRSNLTYKLDEELRNQYGTQVQKNNYMYSVGSGGEISNQYNYDVSDLANLRRQIENNLLTKLNRDFESARQRWISKQNNYEHSQSSNYEYGSSSSNHYGTSANNQRFIYSTPRNVEDDYYRPTSASIVPLISTGVKGNQYHGISGSHQTSYGTSGSSGSIVELQRQLQADLSRQLQAAITQNKAYSTRYSTNGGYGGTFEEAYQRLYDDLQRNLTQQLQEFESGGSSYSTSYGSVSDAQLASLKSQLQRNLASQLQQGLQQSYSASASYSASSGSSASAGAGAYSSSSSGGSYRTTRGSDNYQAAQAGFSGYGQYRSGGSYQLDGEDCQGDDPNAYHSHRTKRSYGYRSRPLGLSTHSGSGYAARGYGEYNTGYNGNFEGYSSTYGRSRTNGQQSLHYVGQEEDDSDLQQVEQDDFTGQQEINVGQQVDDSDDTQKVKVDNDFGMIELESRNKPRNSSRLQQVEQATFTGQQEIDEGQQVDDSDDTQQVKVDNDFGMIELESQNKPQNNGRQQVDGLYSPSSQSIYKPSREPTSIGSHNNYLGFQSNVGQNLSNEKHLTQQIGQEVDDSDLLQQIEDTNYETFFSPKNNRMPFESGTNFETLEAGSSHLSNIGGFASSIYSTTPRSATRERQTENVRSEIPNDYTNQNINKLYDTGIPEVTPLIQSTTEKTITVESNYNNNANPNQKYGQTNLNYKPLGQEPDNSDIENTTLQQQKANGFEHLEVLNQYGNSVRQVKDNSYDNTGIGRLDQNNYPKTTQVEEESNSNDNIYTSNAVLVTKPLSTSSSQTLDLPNEVLNISQQLETKLTKLLESTIKNDITYSTIPPSQQYQNILVTLQKSVNTECQKLIKDNSYTNIDQSDVNKLEEYLNNKLKEKLQQKLHNFVFSQENHGISSLNHGEQSRFHNQYTNFGHSFNYVGGQRHYQYSRGSVHKPTHSQDFIQQEINSQSDTDNEFTENNRQSYDDVGYHTYSNKKPWSPSYNYVYTTENDQTDNIPPKSLRSDNQKNIGSENKLLLNTDEPTRLLNTNVENITPKVQQEWEIGEPGYIPYIQTPKRVIINSELNENTEQQTNKKSIENGTPQHLPAIPVDNQLISYEKHNSSTLPESIPTTATTQNTRKPYFFDYKNFPPLPTPDNSGLVISSHTPRIEISQTSSLPQASTNWDGPHDAQQLINAQREADILIEKLRAAPQNRLESFNHQEGTNSYEAQYDSRIFRHRQPSQNSPKQYEIIQVKLENITPTQLQIINQIDEDFEKLIDVDVQNEIKTASSSLTSYENYQESLKKLEKELKSQITDCIEGNIYPSKQYLGKYSNLIYTNFEQKKIPDLNKYLEIKLLKKLRQKLSKAYKVDNEENTYEFQNGPKTQHHGSYEFPTEYEVKQVKLDNLTPNQVKIINQINIDLTEQIETAIQDHVSSATLDYLSSNENYQILLNKLETELKHNISECVHAATEPGLSKYSDLIVESFDQSKIVKLEQYLQINLIKILRKSLLLHFKIEKKYSFDSNLNRDSAFYNSGNNHYQSRSHYGIQYAHTNNFNLGTEKALEISSIEPQHADAVIPYLGGVKGGRRTKPILEAPANTLYNNPENQPNIIRNPDDTQVTTSSDETAEPTTEKVGWWKRFENKVKQGAANIREKIVGKS